MSLMTHRPHLARSYVKGLPVRRDLIPLVTLDARHAGELLAHPCACGRHRCTLGEHIWQSTRDMTPGPKAQSFEPSTSSGYIIISELEEYRYGPDPTIGLDVQFARAIDAYWTAARNLTRIIDQHRPDRWTPLPDPASDDQWCRHHLETIGQCETRYRGDLCRFCYELKLAHGHLPDHEAMQTRHQLGYLPDRARNEWLTRLPKTRKRKKAS